MLKELGQLHAGQFTEVVAKRLAGVETQVVNAHVGHQSLLSDASPQPLGCATSPEAIFHKQSVSWVFREFCHFCKLGSGLVRAAWFDINLGSLTRAAKGFFV